MAQNEIQVELEYMIKHDNFEPYSHVETFAIHAGNYKVDRPESAQGELIFGLDALPKDRGYILRRQNPVALPEGNQAQTAPISLKVSWPDAMEGQPPITACYRIINEVVDTIHLDAADITWKFVLTKQVDGFALLYVFVRGPGGISPQEDLQAQGIDCNHPRDKKEKLLCRARQES